MKDFKVTIKRIRVGIGEDYLTDVVTAETIRRALDKADRTILTPLRWQAVGKGTVYIITAISLIEGSNK